MAITRRTSNGVIETFSGTAGTGHTINLSDAAVGDVRTCEISGNPDGTGTVGSLTLPSGWNWAGTQTETGAASTGMLSVIYRVVQSGDTLTSATLSLTYNNSVMVASTAETWEGVDTITPLDQTVPTYATGSSPPVSPSITTQTDGALLICAALVDGAPTWGDGDIPSGFTLNGTIVNNPPSNGQNHGSAYQIQATAGASGTKSWTNGGSEEYVAMTYALRPAAEGITSVTPDEFDMDEADVDVASADVFDASGNDVYLSDADTLAGSVNEVDVSSAVNTEAVGLINLDFTQLSAGELASLHTLGPGARYVIVDATGGEYSWPVTLHRPQAFQMALGAATPGTTTSRLTGLTGTFGGGRIEETAAQNPSTTTTNVADDGNREDVWSLEAKLLSREVSYDYRVLYGGNVPDTITQTPQVTVSAAVDYDLVAAGGVYTLSGTAAALAHHAALDAAAGSYAVTGQAATLDLDRLIAAAAGAYTLTGQDAALEHAALLDAAAGAYAVTGQAAGLERAALIDAAAGAYALTGTTADLVYSIKLAAEGGAYALTGQDAGFLRDVILVAAGGAYDVAGQAAGLEYHRLLGAEGGVYAYTGQDADLVTAVSLTAEGGAYALTGQDAGFLQDVILVGEGGAYDVAGQAALLEYHRLMAAEGGAYALTGSDANLVTAVSLVAEGGAYALTGQAAGLIRLARLDAAAGAYDLVGRAAGLIRPSDLQAAGGAYALSGTDAGLDLLRLLAGAGGAYAYAGQDAGFLRALRLHHQAGAYLLVGFDVGLLFGTGPRAFLPLTAVWTGAEGVPATCAGGLEVAALRRARIDLAGRWDA